MRRVLILGIGDIGSAVAHRLFRAGELAVIQDDSPPATSRRRMAFADAMFDGETQLTGVIARLVPPRALSPSTWTVRFIPVTSSPPDKAIESLTPDVIVDARMRRGGRADRMRRRARLTIGLGPGFVPGDQVDIAVETSADNIGRILRSGATLPLRVARDTGGQSRARMLYASRAGVFASRRDIGDAVCCGEAIARIGRQTITAPLSGRLRGLARPGLPIAAGAEIAEIVPPDLDERLVGISDRARCVAEAVLTLVRELRA